MHHYDEKFILIPGAIALHSQLSLADRMVYGAMLALSNRQGACFASQARIAARCDIARETVSRSIKTLLQHDCIRRFNDPQTGKPMILKGGPRNGRTQVYECLYQIKKRKPKVVSMPRQAASSS